MQIEIAKKEGRKGVFSLLIDGDLHRDFHGAIFGYKLSLSAFESLSDLDTHLTRLETQGAMQYALKRLALKGQPSSELRRNLQKKLVTDSVIDHVVNQCVQLGYINDHTWVESFVRSCHNRGYGPQAIQLKLRAKGISLQIAEPFLHAFQDAESQQERITHLLETRYRNRDLSDYRTRQKVIASLLRRGFSLQEVLDTIN